MLRYTIGADVVLIGESLPNIDEPQNDPVRDLVDCMKYFVYRRPLVGKICCAYARANDKQGYVVVRSHGLQRPKKVWKYSDGRGRNYVQDIVDELDGKHIGILLYMCNPRDFTITAKDSIVIHARDSWNHIMLSKNQCKLRVYVPRVGYIEHSHALMRKTLDELL